MYNPSSLKAEEFIDHNEVMDTLAYAAAHADDVRLIDAILQKARSPQRLDAPRGDGVVGL